MDPPTLQPQSPPQNEFTNITAPDGLRATDAEPTDFKLFKPPRTTASTPQSLPDSWFTPTVSELKAAQTALASRVQNLTNAPLRTRAMREASEQPKRERWPTTTIRIRFVDRTQLEKTFPSTNKIRTVYAFVRSCLREDVKPIKFILYQPPKRELKVSDPAVRDLSLYDLQLAPSSVLLIKFQDDYLNHADVCAPLSPSVLAQGEELPTPPDFDKDEEAPSSGSAIKKPSTGGSTSSGGTGKALPKWLKLSSKG